MSSLKRALERSKAAWEAVGKPERARAVLRSASGDTYAGYDGSFLIHVDRATSGKWRAIVPKKADDAGWNVGDCAIQVRGAPSYRGAVLMLRTFAQGRFVADVTKQDGTEKRDIPANTAADWLRPISRQTYDELKAIYTSRRDAIAEIEGKLKALGDVK